MTRISRQVRLASRPTGFPTAENFSIEDHPVRPLEEGEALLRTLYLSLDPYMRGRMAEGRSYAEHLQIGDVMIGGTVSEVIESRSSEVSPGQIVVGGAGWQTHSVEAASGLRVIDPDAAPISTALGVLGMTGFTAYSGLLTIGRPQPGETLAVAAATGPVGATVGQIAKLKGLRTIGIAGGPEKVASLRELGFDAAVDHRRDDLAEQIAEAAPDGIDVYFENVGGAVWEAVLPHLNLFGRVPVCGLAANYNATGAPAGPDRSQQLLQTVLNQSLTIRGFIQTEFQESHFESFLRDMGAWVRDGRITYREDITDGLDNAPETFIGMLSGKNFGKTLIRVADDA
jgi:NADPH-dependent curcumin reductase CurA